MGPAPGSHLELPPSFSATSPDALVTFVTPTVTCVTNFFTRLCLPEPVVGSVVSGHDFSRAEHGATKDSGFSPCKMLTQGLKPAFSGGELRHG